MIINNLEQDATHQAAEKKEDIINTGLFIFNISF